MPTTGAGSTRRAISMVSVPGPQPTSSTDIPGVKRSSKVGWLLARVRAVMMPAASGGMYACSSNFTPRAPRSSVSRASTTTRAPGTDHRGRFALLDDRGAVEARVRREAVAVVDRRVDVAGRFGEVGGPALLDGVAGGPTGGGLRRGLDREVRGRAGQDGAPVQRLDGDPERRAAVQRAIGGLERRGEGVEARRRRARPPAPRPPPRAPGRRSASRRSGGR